jgi:DNA-binding CsgD family transcriptional regulator
MSPAEKERRSWEAYLETGSYREAGRRLGIHEDTVRRHVASLKDQHGVKTTAQLAVRLARAFAAAPRA